MVSRRVTGQTVFALVVVAVVQATRAGLEGARRSAVETKQALERTK